MVVVGALGNLGRPISRETVANILKRHRMAPAPEQGKKRLGKDFVRSPLEVLAAVDFFTAEVWTAGRWMIGYVLAFLRIVPPEGVHRRFHALARGPRDSANGPEHDAG